MSDEILILRIRGGETELFEELLQPYLRSVFALVRSVVTDQADAEDTVQGAVLRAFSNLDRLRSGHAFRAWLFQIAINEARILRRATLAGFVSSRWMRQQTVTRASSLGILRSGTTSLQAGWSARNGGRSCGRPWKVSPADAAKCSSCATSRNSARKKPLKYWGSLHRRSRPGYIELVFNCERNSPRSCPPAVLVRARRSYLESDDSHERKREERESKMGIRFILSAVRRNVTSSLPLWRKKMIGTFAALIHRS